MSTTDPKIEAPEDPDALIDEQEEPVDTEVDPPVEEEDPIDTEVEVEIDPPVDSDPPTTDSDLVPLDTDLVPVDTEIEVVDTDTVLPLEPYYALDGDLLWPESGSWDPYTNAFYVALSEGHVTRIGTAGVQTVWFDHPGAQAGWQTWGVEADPDRRRLFVCVRKGQQFGADWAIWVINLDSGALLRDVPMDNSRNNAQCRDFTVIPGTGTVYVTDRGQDVIHQFLPGSGAISVWAEDPQLETGTWGPDGIAYSEDAGALLVGKSKPPALIRIPLSDPPTSAPPILHRFQALRSTRWSSNAPGGRRQPHRPRDAG